MVTLMRDVDNGRLGDLCYPQLFVARSKIHGLGLFAGEDIEWGRRLIEYQGQPLSNKEVKRRQIFYDSIGFTCLMQFNDGRGIDGVVGRRNPMLGRFEKVSGGYCSILLMTSPKATNSPSTTVSIRIRSQANSRIQAEVGSRAKGRNKTTPA